MGRAPCCDKANVKKGPWSPEEDAKLKVYIEEHGTGGNWIALPQKIGLKRCGKSCRLRWLNYLRPNIKHGGFSEEEENIICSLYISIGSRWSIIAAQLPGRTDNDIKNYWNTRLKKKLMGRQRKEQQARRASMKQEIKRETETTFMARGSVIMTSNQQRTHYWPELPAIMPTVVANSIPNQLDNNNLNFTDQEAIRNLLIKLGGRFSEDHQMHQDQSSFINTNYQVVADSCSTQEQIYASSTSMLSSPATINSIDSTASANYSVNGGDQMMVQGIESFPIELDGYVYGNSGHELEGLEGLYGMDQIANVRNTGTGISTSAESSNWTRNMSNLIYEHQLVSEYRTNCLQSMSQDSPFEDSSHHYYYGPQ